jgi:hypothetical protein
MNNASLQKIGAQEEGQTGSNRGESKKTRQLMEANERPIFVLQFAIVGRK